MAEAKAVLKALLWVYLKAERMAGPWVEWVHWSVALKVEKWVVLSVVALVGQ